MSFKLWDDLISYLFHIVKTTASPKVMILSWAFFHKVINSTTPTTETKRHAALNLALGQQ